VYCSDRPFKNGHSHNHNLFTFPHPHPTSSAVMLSRAALWNCSTPYCHLILSITYNMSPFFLNCFIILVQYIILKLVCFLLHNLKQSLTIFCSSTPTNFNYKPPLDTTEIIKNLKTKKARRDDEVKNTTLKTCQISPMSTLNTHFRHPSS
jgi:hypothetical protein